MIPFPDEGASHAEFVRWLALQPDEKLSYDERLDDAAHTIPRLHKDTLALAPVMLRSGLFTARTGARAQYLEYTALPAPDGYKLELLGEELRQDDERVLLCLMKERSGTRIDYAIYFQPTCFARRIGWSDNGASVRRLRGCIERLHEARVRITHPSGRVDLYSFVSDASLKDTWHVWLSPRLTQIFRASPTYLAASERLALRDGLSSWLYGAIKSDACLVPLSLERLRMASGLFFYKPRDFNKRLRVSLGELLQMGVIEGFQLQRGSIKLRKLGSRTKRCKK